MRFFNSEKEIFQTLLILISIYFLWITKTNIDKKKILFVSLIIVLMGIFSAHKTSKYMLLYMPMLILIITKAWHILMQKKVIYPKWFMPVFLFLIFGYFITNTIFNIQLSLKKFDIGASQKILKTYCKEECSSLNIIAPMTYIFNNITNFSHIHSDLYYTESYSKLHKSLSSEAAAFKIDYIFLENKNTEILSLVKLKKNDTLGNYIVLDKTTDLLVLKNRKNNH
jgi:hypothetical protein